MLNEKEKLKKDGKLNLKETISTIAIAVIIAFLSLNFIRMSTVVGHSMDSTLHDGQKLILNTFIYNNNNPEHGDIIVVERPDLSVRYFIKRVIAIGGDTIEIKNNIVYLNGEVLNEEYLNKPMLTDNLPETKIPEGKVFVMGDNRNNSLDSRSFTIGLIDVKEEILGKAVFSLSDFKFIN